MWSSSSGSVLQGEMVKFCFWRRPKKIQLTGYIYQPCSGWGNSIRWKDFKKRQIVGWQQRKPEIGDEIRFKMQSKKTAQFVVIEVEHCGDPKDMFFADVVDIGYVGEKPLNPNIKEA